MTKLAIATIKATGERFYYEVKQSWNRLYYSFDDGATWHSSKTVAYKTASGSGLLHAVSDITTITATTRPSREVRG